MKVNVRGVVLGAAAGLCLLGAAGSMTGCNTVKGLGKDIHDAGENTEEAIQDAGKDDESK